MLPAHRLRGRLESVKKIISRITCTWNIGGRCASTRSFINLGLGLESGCSYYELHFIWGVRRENVIQNKFLSHNRVYLQDIGGFSAGLN